MKFVIKNRFFLIILIYFFSSRIDASNNLKKYNIGLLIVATGRYIEFVEPLLKSARKHFLPEHNIKYFIFTDGTFNDKNTDFEILSHKKIGWPFDTMNRYQVYYKYRNKYQNLDYLFAVDADLKFIDFIGDEILGKRVAVMHPGFVGRRGPYETNKISKAYVGSKEGKKYFAGGFCGGSKDEFLKMAKTIQDNVEKDLEKNFIATWHDESHLNRYFIDYKPTIMLTPVYGWPEEIKPPYKVKVLFLHKNHKEYQK